MKDLNEYFPNGNMWMANKRGSNWWTNASENFSGAQGEPSTLSGGEPTARVTAGSHPGQRVSQVLRKVKTLSV